MCPNTRHLRLHNSNTYRRCSPLVHRTAPGLPHSTSTGILESSISRLHIRPYSPETPCTQRSPAWHQIGNMHSLLPAQHTRHPSHYLQRSWQNIPEPGSTRPVLRPKPSLHNPVDNVDRHPSRHRYKRRSLHNPQSRSSDGSCIRTTRWYSLGRYNLPDSLHYQRHKNCIVRHYTRHRPPRSQHWPRQALRHRPVRKHQYYRNPNSYYPDYNAEPHHRLRSKQRCLGPRHWKTCHYLPRLAKTPQIPDRREQKQITKQSE